MPTVDIRFVTGSSIVDTAIRAWQKDSWPTHTELVLSDGSLLGALPDGGVAIRPKGYDAATMSKELIVRIPTTAPIAQAFHDCAHSQVGKEYDEWAIGGIALGRDWHDPNKWFCSELMTFCGETSKLIKPLISSIYHVSPRDWFLVTSTLVEIDEA